MDRSPDFYAMMLYAIINCDHLEQVGLHSLQPFAPHLKKLSEIPNLVRDMQIAVSIMQGGPQIRDVSCQVRPPTRDVATQTDPIVQHSRATQTDFCMDGDFLQQPLIEDLIQTMNHTSTLDMALESRRYRRMLSRVRPRNQPVLAPGTSMRRELLHSTPTFHVNFEHVPGVSTSTRSEVDASSLTDNGLFRNAATSTVTTEYSYPNFDTTNQPTTSR